MQSRASTIDAAEVAKFSALAEQWWDPNGKFAPLHRFNPIRLSFIRNRAAVHFHRDAKSLTPFEGLTLLDIGCGGGLLSEPMSRIGFAVTGADASERNVGTARAHAAATGIAVEYICTTAEELADSGRRFDVILNMEVLEHVADVKSFLGSCAALLNPGGLMIVATLNKTLKSLAFAKIGAEFILRWLPIGTHDWNRFIEPDALRHALEEAGLTVVTLQGVSFDPLGWEWQLSRDVDVNYMLVAEKPGPGA